MSLIKKYISRFYPILDLKDWIELASGKMYMIINKSISVIKKESMICEYNLATYLELADKIKSWRSPELSILISSGKNCNINLLPEQQKQMLNVLYTLLFILQMNEENFIRVYKFCKLYDEDQKETSLAKEIKTLTECYSNLGEPPTFSSLEILRPDGQTIIKDLRKKLYNAGMITFDILPNYYINIYCKPEYTLRIVQVLASYEIIIDKSISIIEEKDVKSVENLK